eukprot:3844057-Karenia_brevis.AAC.1
MHPESQHVIAEICRKLEGTKVLPGPVETLGKVLHFLKWSGTRDRPWRWGRENDVELDILYHDKLFKHALRRSIRYALFQQVGMRSDT